MGVVIEIGICVKCPWGPTRMKVTGMIRQNIRIIGKLSCVMYVCCACIFLGNYGVLCTCMLYSTRCCRAPVPLCNIYNTALYLYSCTVLIPVRYCTTVQYNRALGLQCTVRCLRFGYSRELPCSHWWSIRTGSLQNYRALPVRV
jgi:hypothetical protein